MLNDFAKIEESARLKGKIFLVTHDGLFHLDDLMCTALLQIYFKRKNIEVEVIRTRDPKRIPLVDNLIIYDVFDGILDHHGEESRVPSAMFECNGPCTRSRTSYIYNPIADKVNTFLRSMRYEKLVEKNKEQYAEHSKVISEFSEDLFQRRLSSIGKLWRFMKDEIIEEFGISVDGWVKIDREVVAWVDMTDNFVTMNPLTYFVNCLRNCFPPEQAWDECLKFTTDCLTFIIQDSSLLSRDNEELNALPEIVLKNKKFKYSKKFIRGFSVSKSLVGFIWETSRGTLEVKSFGYKKAFLDYKKYVDGGKADDQVIFIHRNGKHGEFKDLTALNSYLVD